MIGIGRHLKHSKCNSFADDTKLVAVISSMFDAANFQMDINSIYEWAAKDSNMMYNPDKFQLLRYGLDSDLQSTTHYLDPCGNPITAVHTATDLGIQMSSSGTFETHTRKTIQSCNFVIAQMMRVFSDRTSAVMLSLYKSLVLSRMDYCSILVTPNTASLRNELEKVQRSFTKRIHGMADLSYWDRLKVLKLQSIPRRHERYGIIYAVKVFLGLVPNFGLTWSLNPHTGLHFEVPSIPKVGQSTAFIRKLKETSPVNRLSKLFNILPSRLKTLPQELSRHNEPLASFKTALDYYLTTVPDEPTDYQRFRAAASNSLLDQFHYSSVKT
jgi:hypothetical protein